MMGLAGVLLLPVFGFLVRPTQSPDEHVHDYSRIRCPACGWQPTRSDTWCCSPGCGHVWNTFETRGLCPSCGRQWRETACLRCSVWSPHDDWYVKKDD